MKDKKNKNTENLKNALEKLFIWSKVLTKIPENVLYWAQFSLAIWIRYIMQTLPQHIAANLFP